MADKTAGSGLPRRSSTMTMGVQNYLSAHEPYIGEKGRRALLASLSKEHMSADSINQTQREFGLQTLHTAPAVEFLNALGVSTEKVYEEMFELLCQELIEKIATISSYDNLSKFLNGIIKYFLLKDLRAIPTEVLNRLSQKGPIPAKIAASLAAKAEIFEVSFWNPFLFYLCHEYAMFSVNRRFQCL